VTDEEIGSVHVVSDRLAIGLAFDIVEVVAGGLQHKIDQARTLEVFDGPIG
jgi:hypothetical protein